MENAPARKSEGAGTLVGDSPLSSNFAQFGKTLFERLDGSRLALGDATADTLLLLMQREGVTATCLWPNTPGGRNITTRASTIIYRLRYRYGLPIETEMRPNVGRPGRHAYYRLRERVRVIPRKG